MHHDYVSLKMYGGEQFYIISILKPVQCGPVGYVSLEGELKTKELHGKNVP